MKTYVIAKYLLDSRRAYVCVIVADGETETEALATFNQERSKIKGAAEAYIITGEEKDFSSFEYLDDNQNVTVVTRMFAGDKNNERLEVLAESVSTLDDFLRKISGKKFDKKETFLIIVSKRKEIVFIKTAILKAD